MSWADQIPAVRHRGLEPEDRDFVLARRVQGHPDSAIARMIGKNLELVRAIETPPELVAKPRVQAFALPAPPSPPRVITPPAEWRQSFPRSVRIVLERTAEKHGVTVKDMIGESRLRIHVWPRQEAMHELYHGCGKSMERIGRYLGKRDHTTVRDGILRHERRIAG